MVPSPRSGFHFGEVLQAGDVIAVPQGPGEPLTLTEAIVAQRHDLPPVSLFIGMTTSRTFRPEHADRLSFRGLNGAGDSRRLATAGVIDLMPMHISSVPGLVRGGQLPVDVAVIRVRPAAEPGFYTTSVISDYTRAIVQKARVVVAELQEDLPLTGDDALIPAEEIDVLVRSTRPLIELPDPAPHAVELEVARQVAALIPDRATIQLGIGALPVAVARALADHRGLGIHSGVISDLVVDLIEAGVVTNAHKGADAGLTVTGGLFGTRRLFDFADANPEVRMRSAEYTHNLAVMAGVERLFTVNSAVEVDLTGQVNSELAGGRYLGAIGGQVDFVRGGVASPGGRSIIALASATHDGQTSRIVASLGNVPVTTSRADVDAIVTEHGVAELRGQPLAERARRLAAIADPRFREELERAARALRTSSPQIRPVRQAAGIS